MNDEQVVAGALVREHDIGPRGSVVVTVEADDVRVRGVDGTTVRLVAPAADHPSIEVVAEPGRYAIRLVQPYRGRVFGFRLGGRGVFGLELGGGGTLELEVPRDARLEISARSGDVSVRDVAGSLAVRTVSGDISLRGGGGDLRIEAASGNLRAVASEPIAATIRTISGDVEIDAPRTQRTSITTVSGDVEIATAFAPGSDHVVNTTSGDVELAVQGGVTIDVRTVSGDVECAHPELRGGTGRRDPLVIGDGAARLAVRTLSGDIEVRAGRVRPDRAAAHGSPIPAVPPRPAAPPVPSVPSRPAVPPVPPVPPLPVELPVVAVRNIEGPNVVDASEASGGPADTLPILEALARGEIDVAEAERRLGAEGHGRG